MSVQRYINPVVQTMPGIEFRVEAIDLIPHSRGPYVLYEDYASEIATLRKALSTASLFCSAGGKAILAKALRVPRETLDNVTNIVTK